MRFTMDTRKPIPGAGRRLLAVSIGALALAGCIDSTSPEDVPAPSFSVDGAATTFDWSMPDRFGRDDDGDGKIDYLRTTEAVSPANWQVDVDACMLPPGNQYWWFVEGKKAASSTSCTHSLAFPAEGVYDVKLVVRGSDQWYSRRQRVTVQDWLIVSFGDSYASGEGIPDIPAVSQATLNQIDAVMLDLKSARDELDAARDELRIFDGACQDIDNWDDVQACADALSDLGVKDVFEAFRAAKDHFEQAVEDARNAVRGFEELLSGFERRAAAEWQGPYPSGDLARVDECHRSANAAPARAALALERSDPRTSVTFIHFACSGAQIPEVYEDDGQIEFAEVLIGPREIDALLLSIGGNDARFGGIAVGCTAQQPCWSEDPTFDPADYDGLCTLLDQFAGAEAKCGEFFNLFPDSSAAVVFAGHVTRLSPRYQTLTDSLTKLTGLLHPFFRSETKIPRRPSWLRANRVYITEYPDMTKSDDGLSYCSFENRSDFLGAMPGWTADELAWADVVVAARLNSEVAAAAGTHGWNYVTGIYGDFREHGYCAAGRYVVRLHESILIQYDHLGIAHPNNAGAAEIAARIAEALEEDLYPWGRSLPPRAPDPKQSEVTEGTW